MMNASKMQSLFEKASDQRLSKNLRIVTNRLCRTANNGKQKCYIALFRRNMDDINRVVKELRKLGYSVTEPNTSGGITVSFATPAKLRSVA